MVRNKKGFTIVEIMVAIAVIGLGAATLCSSIMATMRSSVRAESYTLAKQIANTYSTLASKSVTATNISTLTDPVEVRDESGNLTELTYTTSTVAGPTAADKTACENFFGTDSGIYKALYDDTGTMTLNGIKYDSNCVRIDIKKMTRGTGNLGMYGITVTVTYMDREVSYESTNIYK